jgi:Holliday junction resolvasome RuvABC endonuclease subunit
MKILALDISSKNTGWAVLTDGKVGATGDIPGHPDSPHSAKLHNYRNVVDALIKEHMPDLIAIEDSWSGKNKLVFKILSYYHGVTLELCGGASIPTMIMMPSRFRRIVGAQHNVKLNFSDREAAKLATSSLAKGLGWVAQDASEDVCDASAIGMAASIWQSKYMESLAATKTANPKIRSEKRLNVLADELTEKHFKLLEKANEKSVGRTRD